MKDKYENINLTLRRKIISRSKNPEQIFLKNFFFEIFWIKCVFPKLLGEIKIVHLWTISNFTKKKHK